MAFLDTRFPDNISYGSSGGPMFKTTITVVDSGYEYGNVNWEQAKHEYDAAMGVRTQAELSDLIRFFHVAHGRGHHFRYKDWSDFKSCDVEAIAASTDQLLGIGDGVKLVFQMYKVYTEGGTITSTRKITRPVNGTISVNILGSTNHSDGDLTETTDYTIDYDTGLITLLVVPTAAAVLKWGGEFDVPSRFDTDTLQINLEFYGHGSLGVPIVEVRE